MNNQIWNKLRQFNRGCIASRIKTGNRVLSLFNIKPLNKKLHATMELKLNRTVFCHPGKRKDLSQAVARCLLPSA